MKKVKIEKLELYSGKGEHDVIFNNGQEALLCLIYIKTGLIFLKPEKSVHPLMPDNLREYQNLMLLLKTLISVVDESGVITKNKALLKKNIDVFRHYFQDTWVKQNLSKEQQEDLIQFFEEPIESKNKLLYFKLIKYVEDIKQEMPASIKEDQILDKNKMSNESKPLPKDNYRVTERTPSYNVSLANIFAAMNMIDMQKGYQNMISAISIAYSIVSHELIYLDGLYGKAKIQDLFHGKVMEFSYAENRTYGLVAAIDLEFRHICVEFDNEKNDLMQLNKQVKDIAKKWSKTYKTDSITSNTIDDLAKVISLLVNFLFIYNGYHSTTKDDGVTLEQRFYERDIYFKQKKYTFAPSGFFYKILNLERLKQIILLENINDNLGFNEEGEIIFLGEDNTKNNEMESIISLIELLKDKDEIKKYSLASEESDAGKIVKVWHQLIELESTDLLPYSSFEFLKSISDHMKSSSESQYRRDQIITIKRFKEVKRSGTGFYADYWKEFMRLSEFNIINLEADGIKHISCLKKHYYKFNEIDSIFELMKYFDYKIAADDRTNFINAKKQDKELTKSLERQVRTELEQVEEILEIFEEYSKAKTTEWSVIRNYCKDLNKLFENRVVFSTEISIDTKNKINEVQNITSTGPKPPKLKKLNDLIIKLKEYLVLLKEGNIKIEQNEDSGQ